MMIPSRPKPRRGIALVVVLLVVMAVTAIASGAAYLSLNTALISKYHSRLSVLEAAADAALEETRSALNASSTLYADTGYVRTENNAIVRDVAGNIIPGVRRWTYVGPTGISSGQFGVFGSVVSVVEDANDNRIVRRLEVVQESFARFAYFTHDEGTSQFWNTDIMYGPVHSNDNILLQNVSPGATFWGVIKTAATITNRSVGRYYGPAPGYVENAPVIPFPTTAALTTLQAQAALGGTAFTSSTAGDGGQASMRIEFVAVDLNADGDSTDVDEGFFKVYNATNTANAWWVSGDTTAFNTSSVGLRQAWNCGHVRAGSHATFRTFRHHGYPGHATNANAVDSSTQAVLNGTARYCYLGGSDILNDWTSPPGLFLATDSLGSWTAYPGTVDSRVTAVRTDAAYLWPTSRNLSPNFKGVIHVTGKVAVSGKVRGSVTLAATRNIIIVDNITYVSHPAGTVPCASPSRDMLGLFSGDSVNLADNLINARMPPTAPVSSGTYRAWGNRTSSAYAYDEVIHGVVLGLKSFGVENFSRAPNSGDNCDGGPASRGCIRLVGGVIQYQRGAVGVSAGAGYDKRYDYDKCAGLMPPPYFPTTGRFSRGHVYEVEPTNFDIETFWSKLIPAP